ncbi:hypothetical protein GCM10018783_18900 [Streptomyces griseosporeus]|nr:hypothetical protein GCM10018783_18900 [Streptomyces griseosporeus]
MSRSSAHVSDRTLPVRSAPTGKNHRLSSEVRARRYRDRGEFDGADQPLGHEHPTVRRSSSPLRVRDAHGEHDILQRKGHHYALVEEDRQLRVGQPHSAQLYEAVHGRAARTSPAPLVRPPQ